MRKPLYNDVIAHGPLFINHLCQEDREMVDEYSKTVFVRKYERERLGLVERVRHHWRRPPRHVARQ